MAVGRVRLLADGMTMPEAPPSATAAHGFSSGYASTYKPYPWPDNVQYYAHATILPDSGDEGA
jgi:hypothetical protein